MWFEPAEWMDENDRKDSIHRFKNPTTPEDLATSNAMIQSSIDGFQDAFDYNGMKCGGRYGMGYFDIRISLPSTNGTTKRICEIMAMNRPGLTYHNVFHKKFSRELELDMEMLQRDPGWEDTLPEAQHRLEVIRQKHWNDRHQVKYSQTSFRRYFKNFMGLNQWPNISECITGKNVLMVDDTFGQGITLREATRLILPFRPKSITYFTVVKDYRFSRPRA